MMKRFVCLFICLFVCLSARAAEMANVEYIHQAIKQRWGITVPYNPNLGNPRVAANMKYLLTVVDRANRILSGYDVTSYGNDATYATQAAADTTAVNEAVRRLIVRPFYLVTTPDTSVFSFEMSAAGTFVVDWGDGTQDTITRTNTNLTKYSHNYAATGEYKIGFSGHATAYSTESARTNPTPAIQFKANENVATIHGSIGVVFSTIDDGAQQWQQPMFHNLFRDCVNLTGAIPPELFKGVHGAPVERMFASLFQSTNITGTIPEKLFADIRGAPQWAVFNNLFQNSTISGTIPPKLFAGIKGAPADYMFSNTFKWCSNLTGEIPAGLFSGISGAPAQYMYNQIFYKSPGLTGQIPENLFGNITGDAAEYMFKESFFDCVGLTGPSARQNGRYLYEIWPNAGQGCYGNVTGLTDYADIPAAWK